MAIPSDTKDRAVYHTILADLHRVQGITLNLQMLDEADTAESLRDHFTRDRTLTLARVNEWRLRRPEIYRQASEDFQHQMK